MRKMCLSLNVLLMILFLQACSGDDSDSDEEIDDSTPTAFYFSDKYGAGVGVYAESNTFEVEGINVETDISIDGGEYSINGGAYTNADGTVTEGQNVTVRVLTSDDLYSTVSATLTIGDVGDTFSVRTTSLALSARASFKGLTFFWTGVSSVTHYRLWYQKNSESEFEQYGRNFDGSVMTTRVEIPVHRFDWFNAKFKLEACIEGDCFETKNIDVASLRRQTVGYFKPDNTDAFDAFGVVALSADGNTLAVAATGEDSAVGIDGDRGNNVASGAGAVYVYTKLGMDWYFQSYIKASNVDAGDNFGASLSLSGDGNTLAVGAPYEDSSAVGVESNSLDNTSENSGAVYVYKRLGGVWLQQSYLKPSDTTAQYKFGSAVALSAYGQTLAVGSLGHTNEAGAVTVFSDASESWAEETILTAPNSESGDYFGSAVSLSANGDTLIVGAPRESSNSAGVNQDQADNNAPFSGAAYLFERNNTAWSFKDYLKASNTEENQLFGASVAVSENGQTVAVGAPGESSNGFGVNGDQGDSSSEGSGAAYIFSKEVTNEWLQQAYIKSSDGDANDNFGQAIALNANGNLFVVGAPREDSANEEVDSNDADNAAADAGAAYVFELNEQWQLLKYVKAPNAGAGDRFGQSVALDASGNALAVGAPAEDSHHTGVDANQNSNTAQDAGAVYLY